MVDGGLRGETPGRGKTAFYGLAPDGTRSVSLVLFSGEVIHARVLHNVYFATVSGSVRALIIKTAGGSLRWMAV